MSARPVQPGRETLAAFDELDSCFDMDEFARLRGRLDREQRTVIIAGPSGPRRIEVRP